MTRDDAWAGTMGRVGKRRREPVVCAVDDCERVAVYTIHIELSTPGVGGISVPMCREHGDEDLSELRTQAAHPLRCASGQRPKTARSQE